MAGGYAAAAQNKKSAAAAPDPSTMGRGLETLDVERERTPDAAEVLRGCTVAGGMAAVVEDGAQCVSRAETGSCADKEEKDGLEKHEEIDD
jgi:hypothetical protein